MTRLQWLLECRKRLDQEIAEEQRALSRLLGLSEEVREAVEPDAQGLAVGGRVAVGMAAVERTLGFSPAAIQGPSREQEIVDARMAAAWVLRDLGVSYPAIGRAINRDHTTAMYAVRKVEESPELTAMAMTARLAVESARTVEPAEAV